MPSVVGSSVRAPIAKAADEQTGERTERPDGEADERPQETHGAEVVTAARAVDPVAVCQVN
jgi:hypothetical protein